MAVSRDTTTTHVLTTDADFRAWATAVHNALVAVGLVQTSDTGQIDRATVLRPATNTDAGYEIFRFDDASQASWPIYFKVYFGIGNVASKPRLNVEVGEGSSGAGALSGTVMTTSDLSGTVYPGSNPSGAGGIHVAHSGGALVVALFGIGLTNPYGFHIERLRDTSGNLRDGWYAGTWGASASKIMTNDGTTEFTAVANGTNFQMVLGQGSTTGVDGSDVHLGSLHPQTKKIEPMVIGMIPYKLNDIAEGVLGSVTVHTQTKNYRASNVAYQFGNGNNPMLLLNE